MKLVGSDSDLLGIYRSGDDTDEIRKAAQEITFRANESLNNRGKSLFMGKYWIGFPPDVVRRLRNILDSIHR